MSDSAKRAVKEASLAGGIFASTGAICALLIVWRTYESYQSGFSRCLPFVLDAAISAGIAGGCAWWAACAVWRRWSAWRLLLVGVAAGLFCHPVFWFLGGVFSAIGNVAGFDTGGMLSFREIAVGCLFGLMFLGIVTVPAGLVASLTCRVLIAHPPGIPRSSSPTDPSRNSATDGL